MVAARDCPLQSQHVLTEDPRLGSLKDRRLSNSFLSLLSPALHRTGVFFNVPAAKPPTSGTAKKVASFSRPGDHYCWLLPTTTIHQRCHKRHQPPQTDPTPVLDTTSIDEEIISPRDPTPPPSIQYQTIKPKGKKNKIKKQFKREMPQISPSFLATQEPKFQKKNSSKPSTSQRSSSTSSKYHKRCCPGKKPPIL